MNTLFFKRAVAVVGFLALFGAGCPVTRTGPTSAKPMAFGKLPPLGPLASAPQAGTPSAVTKDQAMMEVSSGVAGVGATGIAKPMPPTVRPIPYPYPSPRPVTVEYLIEGALPTWESEGEVLQSKSREPDPSLMRSWGAASGLPSELLSQVSSLLALNVEWQDADRYHWSFQGGNSSLNFWQDNPVQEQQPKQPDTPIDPGAYLKIADAFLDSHGFSNVRQTGGTVMETPEIQPLMMKSQTTQATGIAQTFPCMMESGDAVMMKGETPTIARMPCWFPQVVTVVYGGVREGRKVTDPYGTPAQSASISISISSKQVNNGAIQLEGSVTRSSYPLIDQETARRRLESGGRNPVWPWGTEDGNIVVHLKNLELVWLRYDRWQDGKYEMFDLPGLLASGTVDRKLKGQPPEEYRTVIPLLKDDVFEETPGLPSPVPLPGVEGGGVQIMPAPVTK